MMINFSLTRRDLMSSPSLNGLITSGDGVIPPVTLRLAAKAQATVRRLSEKQQTLLIEILSWIYCSSYDEFFNSVGYRGLFSQIQGYDILTVRACGMRILFTGYPCDRLIEVSGIFIDGPDDPDSSPDDDPYYGPCDGGASPSATPLSAGQFVNADAARPKRGDDAITVPRPAFAGPRQALVHDFLTTCGHEFCSSPLVPIGFVRLFRSRSLAESLSGAMARGEECPAIPCASPRRTDVPTLSLDRPANDSDTRPPFDGRLIFRGREGFYDSLTGRAYAGVSSGPA